MSDAQSHTAYTMQVCSRNANMDHPLPLPSLPCFVDDAQSCHTIRHLNHPILKHAYISTATMLIPVAFQSFRCCAAQALHLIRMYSPCHPGQTGQTILLQHTSTCQPNTSLHAGLHTTPASGRHASYQSRTNALSQPHDPLTIRPFLLSFFK